MQNHQFEMLKTKDTLKESSVPEMLDCNFYELPEESFEDEQSFKIKEFVVKTLVYIKIFTGILFIIFKQVGKDLIREEVAQTNRINLSCYKYYISSVGPFLVLLTILSYGFVQVRCISHAILAIKRLIHIFGFRVLVLGQTFGFQSGLRTKQPLVMSRCRLNIWKFIASLDFYNLYLHSLESFSWH